MAGLLVLYGAWQVLRWPAGNRPLVGNLWFVLFAFGQTLAAFAAGRRCPPGSRLRGAWWLLALGSTAYLVGQLIWAGYELSGRLPYPSVGDGFSLCVYPLTLAGLLRFPGHRRDRQELIRTLLDMALVILGGGLLVVYVVLGPTLVAGGPQLQTVFSVAYPVGDLILLVGLGSILVRGTVPSSARALQFMAAGLVFFVAANLAYGYITLHGTYVGGDPADTIYVVAMALLAIGASAQSRPLPEGEEALRVRPRRPTWLPYLSLFLGLGIMLYSERGDGFYPNFLLALGTAVLATLVAIRQYLAQRDLVQTEVRLSHQSLHDALTGLPNRVLAIDRAMQMLARAHRSEANIAALHVDVDAFKDVNDSFGHAAGDEVLRVVGARLCEVVREADTVARLGSDDFVLLLDSLTLDAGPELVAERVRDVLGQPIELPDGTGRWLSVTVSIGIASGGADGSADSLFRDADLALHDAKRSGKNRWAVFESAMQKRGYDRLAMQMELRDAIDRDELFMLYQPAYDLRSETIIAVEALIRWQHPTRGVVAPGDFIPLAEDTGLIVPVGRWVLRTACRQGVAWHRAGLPLRIAANVSAAQLDHPYFVRDVADVLTETGIDATLVTLEITETALMRNPDAAAQRLRDLKALGVMIAIDDFGTGYSSLAYLRQFPVDALKIDRSFVSGITHSSVSKALVHTLIELAQTLGLRTIGEGIEEEAQLRHLHDEGCDAGQGFLLSRPVPAAAISPLIAGSSPLSA
jgi:diguanylate cyclase (GGDEF)-like protein